MFPLPVPLRKSLLFSPRISQPDSELKYLLLSLRSSQRNSLLSPLKVSPPDRQQDSLAFSLQASPPSSRLKYLLSSKLRQDYPVVSVQAFQAHYPSISLRASRLDYLLPFRLLRRHPLSKYQDFPRVSQMDCRLLAQSLPSFLLFYPLDPLLLSHQSASQLFLQQSASHHLFHHFYPQLLHRLRHYRIIVQIYSVSAFRCRSLLVDYFQRQLHQT